MKVKIMLVIILLLCAGLYAQDAEEYPIPQHDLPIFDGSGVVCGIRSDIGGNATFHTVFFQSLFDGAWILTGGAGITNQWNGVGEFGSAFRFASDLFGWNIGLYGRYMLNPKYVSDADDVDWDNQFGGVTITKWPFVFDVGYTFGGDLWKIGIGYGIDF